MRMAERPVNETIEMQKPTFLTQLQTESQTPSRSQSQSLSSSTSLSFSSSDSQSQSQLQNSQSSSLTEGNTFFIVSFLCLQKSKIKKKLK